jgi:hypothetical protein
VTRILLDPEELATTAAGLSDAAGEYQAIGARIASCDCGCMPPDVAATVDAATGAIRSRLGALSAELSAGGGELAWRSGIQQNGGGLTTATSSASGPGVDAGTMVIGGTTSDFGLDASGGMSLVIGGSFDMGVFGGTVASTAIVGGSDPLSEFFGGNPLGTTVSIGSGDPLADFFGTGGEGSTLVIGGSFSPSVGGPSMGDALLSLAATIGDRQRAMWDELSRMPPVYVSPNDPIITSMVNNELWRQAFDAQRRLDVVMSPGYHSSGYFSSYSDYLRQFPADIRYR